MGYKETANFNTRGDGSNFLVDLSQIALPAAGAAIGAFAGNPMLGYQVGNMGARAIAGNNQVSSGAQMANGLMGMGASFLGSGSNESVKANGGNIPQVMMYNGGGTHEQNPLGGIPVDGLGNPSMQSTALVEANEVGYKLPNDQSGYVFSDRIKYPGKKGTYSDEAKRILSRYKNRLGKDLDKPDALAKKSLDTEIAKLKEEQEYSKAIDQQQQQIKAYGGDLPKYDGPSTATQQLPNNDADNYLKGAGYKEALTGYGIQAATRIPQLFTTPEKISYDRVNPETIDLAQERANMQTSRNTQLGMLKRQASMAGSAGQALNYLGSAIPTAYNQYDQGYNQSIEREANANTQIRNQANAQNTQIQMKEAEANAMERDAARSIRDQAIADIGNISAQGYGLKSRLMQGYYGLKAQAATGDYNVSWDKDGQFTQSRRRDDNSTNTNFSGNYNLPIGLQPQFATPDFNIAGANKQLGYTPQSTLMGNKFKLNYQQTISPVTAPEPQLQLDNTDFYMPTEINVPDYTLPNIRPELSQQEAARAYKIGLDANPRKYEYWQEIPAADVRYEDKACGGKLCKGGYIKKKGKK